MDSTGRCAQARSPLIKTDVELYRNVDGLDGRDGLGGAPGGDAQDERGQDDVDVQHEGDRSAVGTLQDAPYGV